MSFIHDNSALTLEEKMQAAGSPLEFIFEEFYAYLLYISTHLELKVKLILNKHGVPLADLNNRPLKALINILFEWFRLDENERGIISEAVQCRNKIVHFEMPTLIAQSSVPSQSVQIKLDKSKKKLPQLFDAEAASPVDASSAFSLQFMEFATNPERWLEVRDKILAATAIVNRLFKPIYKDIQQDAVFNSILEDIKQTIARGQVFVSEHKVKTNGREETITAQGAVAHAICLGREAGKDDVVRTLLECMSVEEVAKKTKIPFDKVLSISNDAESEAAHSFGRPPRGRNPDSFTQHEAGQSKQNDGGLNGTRCIE